MKPIFRALSPVFLVLLLVSGPAAAHEATPRGSSATSTTAGLRAIEVPNALILALSPDGKWIAASTPANMRAQHLCVYNVETLAEQSCADLSGLKELRQEDVVWSPDSTRIALDDNGFLLHLLDSDLWMMDAATGKLTDLTDDGFDGTIPIFRKENVPATPIYGDILPAWSPDGRSITFSRSPIITGELKGNQIAQIDLATGPSNVTTLIPVTLDEPSIVYYGMIWALDGQHLYYSIMHLDMKNPDNGVWVYDMAAGTAKQLLKSDLKLGSPAIMEINAGGDTGLVFYPRAAAKFGATGQLFTLLDLHSGKTLPVAPGLQDEAGNQLMTATFSPDGTQVLYTVNTPSDGGQVLMRDLHDDEATTVASGLPHIISLLSGRDLTWATNGTTLVLTDLTKGVLVPLGTTHSTPPAPVIASPVTSPAASPTMNTTAIGQTVTLTMATALHATPPDQGQVVLTLRPGAHLTVSGEPVPSDGQIWIPALEPATGTIGDLEVALLR